MHLSCIEINTISKWIEASFHLTHITYESHRVRAKMICKPIARSAQTVQLSCVKISRISKETETSFHLTHITKELHHLCQQWFLSLWYVRSNLCTYLVPRLILSSNGLKRASTRPKQASIWPVSPRSSIICAQNDFWAYGMFVPICAPILRRD
jgi:hypothetical protein